MATEKMKKASTGREKGMLNSGGMAPSTANVTSVGVASKGLPAGSGTSIGRRTKNTFRQGATPRA